MSSLSSEDRLRALLERIVQAAPTRRLSASGLAESLGETVRDIAPAVARLIADRMIEQVTESRCVVCGQQPEEDIDPDAEELDCPDHGEQQAQHYQLYQFTRAYREEQENNPAKKDDAAQDAAPSRVFKTDSQDLKGSPESRNICDAIDALHDTIKKGQKTPAPEGPVARRSANYGKWALIVGVVVGILTVFFAAADWSAKRAAEQVQSPSPSPVGRIAPSPSPSPTPWPHKQHSASKHGVPVVGGHTSK